MNTWFTADYHFGSINAVDYFNRPFKKEELSDKLIKRWNERVKPEDIVYHIGDFCHTGPDSRVKAKDWEKRLNGKIVHCIGNHDSNNSTKCILQSAIFTFGGYRAWVQHIPPQELSTVENSNIDFIIAGHVHCTYKHKFITLYESGKAPKQILVINVGVDVWNYYPVKMNELLVYYEKLLK